MANQALTGSSSIVLSGSVVLRRNTDVEGASSALTNSSATYERVIDRTGASTATTDSTATYVLYADLTGASSAVAESFASATGLFNITGASSATITSTATYDGASLDVWTLNAGNNAVGRYTEFDHNGIAYVNGKTYVTNDDGIFELTGTTDDGQNQKVFVESGLEQPGEFISYPRYAYLIGKIPERVAQAALGLTFAVSDDHGTRWDYPINSTTNVRQTTRVSFGRGLRVRFIQYSIRGEINEQLQLTGVETIYDATQRNLE